MGVQADLVLTWVFRVLDTLCSYGRGEYVYSYSRRGHKVGGAAPGTCLLITLSLGHSVDRCNWTRRFMPYGLCDGNVALSYPLIEFVLDQANATLEASLILYNFFFANLEN